MNWRDHLEETILAIMPFCFKNGTNLRGELDRPEFYGEDDTLVPLGICWTRFWD